MKFVKLFMALVGLALVFIFCKDNDTKVVIRFLDYQSPEIYLFLLIMTTFVLGMIAASFANTLKIIQLKRQIKQLQPEAAEAGKAATAEKKKDRKAPKQEKETAEAAPAAEPAAPQSATVVETPAAVMDAAPQSQDVSDAVYEEPDTTVTETPAVIELPAGPVAEPQRDKPLSDEPQPKQP